MKTSLLFPALLLAAASTQALQLSTADAAAWEQSLDNVSWQAAQVADFSLTLNGQDVAGLWPAGVEEGPTVYFRTSFSLPSAGYQARLWVGADDDSTVWVNGQQVWSENDLVISVSDAIDVTPWLVVGSNQITASASSYFCCGRTFVLVADVSPVPEPQSWALLLAGMGGIGAWLRRRRPNR